MTMLAALRAVTTALTLKMTCPKQSLPSVHCDEAHGVKLNESHA